MPLLVAVAIVAGCAAGNDDAGAVGVSITDQSISLDHAEIPAGHVRLDILNEGTEVHELELFIGHTQDFTVTHNVADTSSSTRIDEVEDLVPGTSVTLDVVLEPGTYVVMSNYPGEFERGLVAELQVTG